MRIILHKGDPLVGVHKVNVHAQVKVPYVEIIWKVKQNSDPKARIIGTEPLSNVRKIKND